MPGSLSMVSVTFAGRKTKDTWRWWHCGGVVGGIGGGKAVALMVASVVAKWWHC